jgi:two-component system chemotaxis response regulator CheY
MKKAQSSFSVLIVDDSATTRALIKRTLRLANLPVGELYEASNGFEALAVMDRYQVDLVLADLHMPEMGGVELTRAMRAEESMREIPVVIVSAEPNSTKLDELRKAPGVRGCIRKPFTPETVRDVVAAMFAEVAHVG